MNAVGWMFLILGSVFIVYFCIISIYAGFGTSFGWFWLLAGAVCAGISVLFRWTLAGHIYIPRMSVIISGAVLCLGLIVFIILEGMIICYGNKKPEPGADYMIVLGAQIRGNRITKSLKYRLDAAAEYAAENEKTTVIVSGGQGLGEDISEAYAMKRYLTAAGIPENRIIEENKSINTNENISFSKAYIEGTDKRVLIVTNGFHVYRGVSIAKKQNIGLIEGLGASADRILLANYYVREAFAVIKDALVGNL